jgi:hypothetical protein
VERRNSIGFVLLILNPLDAGLKLNVLIGDKSNHIPSIHIPQIYYFIDAITFFGWPVLISYPGGTLVLIDGVKRRMSGSK